eukprot:CAMPEP_0195537900 /NCGR_PEP_ID=MMETSP0794_2-20130614/48855_1 /TAXON_ID=515487 /ORGANISM="Stephanopyxis turris, Strain CCMP 815" /LENGTH=69 /DNA_ID=CAMNT_0040671773 /DNA_START=349 /DNA_END=558 /DNA_ORIENTATION=-
MDKSDFEPGMIPPALTLDVIPGMAVLVTPVVVLLFPSANRLLCIDSALLSMLLFALLALTVAVGLMVLG